MKKNRNRYIKRCRVAAAALVCLTIWSCYGQNGQEERGINTVEKYEEESKVDQKRYKLAEQLKIPAPGETPEDLGIHCYDYEVCREKGLLEEGRPGYRYLCMQALYRANLDDYLSEQLELETLNEELKNSELGFVRRKPEDRNLYERVSTMDLEFIYLRNNLYIEYLEEEQLELLEVQLTKGAKPVTDEIREMVKDTYQEVVRVRDPKNRESKNRFLYPKAQGSRPEIPNQALVLEITNAMEYDTSGNLLPGNRMREKCEYLDRIKKKKEKEYSGILNAEVYILTD